MSRVQRWWLDLNSSLWFVPSLMVLAAVLAAYSLVHLDDSIGHEWTQRHPLLFGAGADGARGMLSAIASSMITVAGLIFSLTLSTLAQVSSQYTSRLLRNFMRDRPNQVVMGFFVSIFVYCLMVLRTIRGGDQGAFVPSLAVAFGLLLALVSIGMLIFFIHHIASSIQAANVIGGAAAETEKTLNKLFPTELGEAATPAEKEDLADLGPLNWVPIVADESGYIVGIDEEALLAFACETDAVVRMEHAIGSYVTKGSLLASAVEYPNAKRLVGEDSAERINKAYSIGNQRTLDQDAGFGLRQLVDIGLKALSPGINDTSTAVLCIDRLGSLLALLAGRDLGNPVRAEAGVVRVIAQRPDFASYLATAFDQVRANAAEDLAIYLRLLAALRTVAQRTSRPAYRQALRQQADLALAAADKNITVPYESEQVHQQYRLLRQALDA
ncbi:DUF2254 domain-containing protein [Hymenobacter sp. BT559]|uniref:DUF2254 domain-containing protein n=1 Tax=Hymenobacter sp. BT559 TaxID=2795729 RepID=UPI0018EBCE6A|nr:DUF2254 domain-containing protein [Hymenobacter sp. BT559]MBJ6142151.1 DUF2254 domain-containing protein [Hymenobacter sp. BT559]